MFCNNDQDNWATLCPILELTLNSRTSSTTGVSPFFLHHGYHNTPFNQTLTIERTTADTQEQAREIVKVITRAADWAISAMSYAQQEQERQANKSRKPAPTYKVGDWVWLDLRDVRTTRTSKKLDWKCEKFQVSRVRDPYWVELATPWATKSYHVDKLRPVATDPLPSQQTNDSEPAAVIVRDEGEDEDHLEWHVEAILNERVRQGKKQYLVKWVGFQKATWEPEKNLANTTALHQWQNRIKTVQPPTTSRHESRNQRERRLSRPRRPNAHQEKVSE